jgi:hypothetical protein
MKNIGTRFAWWKIIPCLVDIISFDVYNLWIMILFLIGTLVFQNGDTLFFTRDSSCVDTVVMHTWIVDGRESVRVTEKAKVGPDNTTYLIHSSVYSLTAPESLLSSTIKFYDAQKNKLLEETSKGGRNISYDLSNIHDSIFVITTWDRQYGKPALYVVKDDKKIEIVKEGDWERIVSYEVSSNNRYVLFHARNPYHEKPWDYIYFYDLTTGRNWDYLFPSCLSCKKSRIYLKVNNDGRAEVIHKNEHRVFSPDGVLEDIYLKLQ